MQTTHHYFQMRRLTDDVVYEFDQRPYGENGRGYQRRDKPNTWVIFKPEYGWVVIDDNTGHIHGRPWDVLVKEQSDFPPEGEWVSKKGAKSYVYELVYGNTDA